MGSKDYFDKASSQWDDMRHGFFPDSLREKIILTAETTSGATAADIGAGTGFITEGLLKLGVEVIAVDQSAKMLENLKSKFPIVDTRQGVADSLPIDSGSVEMALANMYLHHVKRPSAAIAEMARILKPGGRLVIADLDKHNHEFLRIEQHDVWMGFDRAEVADWLTAAGLVEVTVDCADADCQAESESAGSPAKVSIFIASGHKPQG